MITPYLSLFSYCCAKNSENPEEVGEEVGDVGDLDEDDILWNRK